MNDIGDALALLDGALHAHLNLLDGRDEMGYRIVSNEWFDHPLDFHLLEIDIFVIVITQVTLVANHDHGNTW